MFGGEGQKFFDYNLAKSFCQLFLKATARTSKDDTQVLGFGHPC
jgi:hypothetical protein